MRYTLACNPFKQMHNLEYTHAHTDMKIRRWVKLMCSSSHGVQILRNVG